VHFTSLNSANISFDRPSSIGCLFFHGFTSTPEEFRELAQYLADEQISVEIPLLPGHGKTPAELSQTKWTDWVDCAREAYFNLRKNCQQLFVGGQSMGGTLALHLASHYPVNGILAYAAPIEFHHSLLRFIPLLKRFIRYYPKSQGNDVADEAAKSRLPAYQVYPLPAISEFQKLIKHTFFDVTEITAPILLMHSRQDHTIPLSSSELILGRVRSTEKKLVRLEKSYHLLTVDYEKEIVRRETLQFIRRFAHLDH